MEPVGTPKIDPARVERGLASLPPLPPAGASAGPELTVAIPTWNRLPELRHTLTLLLPQLAQHAGRCNLVLVDNCSDQVMSAEVADLLAQFPGADVTIRRNTFNIGGDANILRCFEVSEAPWLWVLGDDDAPRPDALDTILGYVRRHPDCIYFNFSTNLYSRPDDYLTHGAEEFVRGMDSFINVVFISASVVRQHALRPYMHRVYHFVYTHAVETALVLSALRDLGGRGACCFAKASSVAFKKNERFGIWDDSMNIIMALDLPVLLELPIPYDLKRELYRKMFHWLHSADWCFTPLLRGVGSEEERRLASYKFDQICARGARFQVGRRLRARTELKRLILKLPYPVLARAERLRQKMRQLRSRAPTGPDLARSAEEGAR